MGPRATCAGAALEPIDDEALAGCSDQDLADAIGQLHALEQAARHQRLQLVAEYDAREAWRADGARNMVAWLCQVLFLSWATARQDVAAAAALRDLPHVAAVSAHGGLSADQLHQLCRFATPDTDEALAAEAPTMAVRELEARAVAARPPTAEDAAGARRRREVRFRRDPHDPTTGHVTARLPIDEWAKVKKRVERVAHQTPARSGDDDEPRRPWASRCGEALVRICADGIARDPNPDRATVVAYVDLDKLADDDAPGSCTLEGGIGLAPETARRLACDCRLHLLARDRHGDLAGYGTTTPTVPYWLRRVIVGRDRHCRFPGCDRTIDEIHHVVHRAHGGPTLDTNLAGLCWHHHHTVHEGGWTLTGDPRHDLTFTAPDGRRRHSRPPPPLGTRPATRPPGLRPTTRQTFAA